MPKIRFSAPLMVVLIVAFSVFLFACYPSHPQSTFDAAGPVAEMQKDLFALILWLGLAVFVIVMAVFAYALFRFRAKPGQEMPKQTHGNNKLEVAWTIAPVIILVVITVPTITGIFYLDKPPSDQDALEVRVVGHQWWWEFEYPELTYTDTRGQEQALVTANELHIPVGRPVNFELLSADVIHSFWVPKLGGKQDLIPNNVRRLWFQADEPGKYFGQCAEFCGLSHALMRLEVIAEPEADFNAWVALQTEQAVEPTDARAVLGSELFVSKGCAGCHTIKGKVAGFDGVAGGTIGPDLTHLASRDTIASGVLDRNDDNLSKWLSDSLAVKPGNIMGIALKDSNIQLSDNEISALVAYLQALK